VWGGDRRQWRGNRRECRGKGKGWAGNRRGAEVSYTTEYKVGVAQFLLYLCR